MSTALLVGGGVATALLGYAAYLGAFRSIVFSDDTLPTSRLYYVPYKGPYHKVNKTFQKVCDIADKLITGKFDGTLAGLYFDNPSETPEADCRAFIGIMLKGEKHDPKLLDALEAEGMRYIVLPQTRYRKAVFPFKNFLSVILAVLKVYPAANKCRHLAEGQEDLACGKMELYEPSEIVFVFPLENAAAFQHPDGPYDAKKKS